MQLLLSYLRQFGLGLSFIISTYSAYGWTRPVHMVIGAIAYQDLLARSPRQLASLTVLLRKHPDAQTRWAYIIQNPALTEDEKKRYLFMLASSWPDDIKGENNPNNHPGWHFINYVYNLTKGIARTDTILGTGENILQAFERNRQILNSNEPDDIRAIALCWVIHLVGDIHMPLHAATLISSQFPASDRGGNIFWIKVSMGNPTLSLHFFWDSMLINTDGLSITNELRAVDQLVLQLTKTHPHSELLHHHKSDMQAWSLESFKLAQAVAYRQGTIQTGTDLEGAMLPSGYVELVKPVAEKQVAWAGHRLANLLMIDMKNRFFDKSFQSVINRTSILRV